MEWCFSAYNSEYEPKQPQLQPKPTNADPQALQRARPARTEFATEDFLPNNPFTYYSYKLHFKST